MTGLDAARRGAAITLLCAVLAFALAICVGEVHAWPLPIEGRARFGMPPSTGLVTMFADVLLDIAQSAGLFAVGGALVVASAVTGGVMGTIAARTRGGPVRRVILLSFTAVPALWLIVATTWAIGSAPRVIVDGPEQLPWIPLGALWFATFGVVVGAPLLVPLAVVGAVLLEGSTRPASLRQAGMARPELRRATLLTLTAVATMLLTFAVLNWPRS